MSPVTHVPGWRPVEKMDTPVGLYSGICSCGWRGTGLRGSPEQATRDAAQHADAKNGQAEGAP